MKIEYIFSFHSSFGVLILLLVCILNDLSLLRYEETTEVVLTKEKNK